jgi:hypothetical protein
MFRTSIVLGVLATATALAFAFGCSNTDEAADSSGEDIAVQPALVISQVYAGAATPNPPYAYNFVELFNRGAFPVSLADLSLQYAEADAAFDAAKVFNLPAKTLEAGQYFLVRLGPADAVADGGRFVTHDAVTPLTPDATTPPDFVINVVSGKLALVHSSAPLAACGAVAPPKCATGAMVDLVGYGTAKQFLGAAAAGALSPGTAATRKNAGCTDALNNGADFDVTAPPAPRNMGTIAVCPTVDAGAGPQVLLNEVNVGPSGITDTVYGYAEILCTPRAPLLGYYFVATDSTGTANVVVDLGTKACGANGLVYIKTVGASAGYPVQLVETQSVVLSVLAPVDGGAGAAAGAKPNAGFMIVRSPSDIPVGTDFDKGDDGTADLPPGVTIVDGISLAATAAAAPKYVPRPTCPDGSLSATRFVGKKDALSATSWYAGSLKGAADARDYDKSKSSANLPAGAMLTPGAPNFDKAADTSTQDTTDGGTEAGPADDVEHSSDATDPGPPAPPPGPPALRSADAVCALSSGPASGPRFAAFALLAIALASLRRRSPRASA